MGRHKRRQPRDEHRDLPPLDEIVGGLEGRQCSRKVRHGTRVDAERAAREDPLNPKGSYQCGWCRGWHVGGAGRNPG